jgi:hypothetical protein
LRQREPETPFYERVNRFFFGPEKTKADPLEIKRIVLAEARAKKGRVGLIDIMRVTGLSKEEADPLIVQMLLEYEGEVTVSESGAIVYDFSAIRKTVQAGLERAPEPIWNKKEPLLPLTGNRVGSNFLIAGLNGFNLMMSSVAITGGWTIEKLQWMFAAGKAARHGFEILPPPESTPLLLGVIPFWFSLALFALPIGRLLFRGGEKKRVERVNGKRGFLRALLSRLPFGGVKEETLAAGWKDAAGAEPSSKDIVREAVRLGGQLDVNDNTGEALYRFPDLERESAALKEARQKAGDDEAKVGTVVFSSAQ